MSIIHPYHQLFLKKLGVLITTQMLLLLMLVFKEDLIVGRRLSDQGILECECAASCVEKNFFEREFLISKLIAYQQESQLTHHPYVTVLV